MIEHNERLNETLMNIESYNGFISKRNNNYYERYSFNYDQ
jgi:hypothetical protein